MTEVEPRSLLHHSQPNQERSIFQRQEVVYLSGIDQGTKPGRHRQGWRTSEHEAAALLANSQAHVNCVDGTACNELGQETTQVTAPRLGSDQVTAHSLTLFGS